MKVQKNITSKILWFLAALIITGGISIAALYLQSQSNNTPAVEAVVSAMPLFVVIGVLSMLVALNFVFFHANVSKFNPVLARILPLWFAVAATCFFFIYKFILRYPLSARGAVISFVVVASVWTLLNVVVYFTVKKLTVK